jgi:hypothetical protein
MAFPFMTGPITAQFASDPLPNEKPEETFVPQVGSQPENQADHAF